MVTVLWFHVLSFEILSLSRTLIVVIKLEQVKAINILLFPPHDLYSSSEAALEFLLFSLPKLEV
jgi:hypothetical protein